MGLEAERLEPAMDLAIGDSGFSGEAASAALGTAVAGPLLRRRLRLGLQRSVDHFSYLVVVMDAGTAGKQLVMQNLDAEFPVALSPYPYGHPLDAHSHGNRGVRFTGATSQNYLGSLHESVWP